MNWVGVKCPWGQDTLLVPEEKISRGGGQEFYPGVKCPWGQDSTWYLVPGDKILLGPDKLVHPSTRPKTSVLKVWVVILTDLFIPLILNLSTFPHYSGQGI